MMKYSKLIALACGVLTLTRYIYHLLQQVNH